MTVVGSDNFADAPLLAVGMSSAYTPNAGYATETGEPSAWGGRTAWWRVEPTVSEFHYIDVLYSTGSTRAWVYRSFDLTPEDFTDLTLVNDPGADTQGGWNAAAGGLYFIRLDSDGSDVSYVASVGMTTYDLIRERYPLTGAKPDPDPGNPNDIVENHFEPDPQITGEPWESVYYGLVADAVSGAPGATEFGSYAEMLVGQFASEVVEEYPVYNDGDPWYGDPPDETYGHPGLTFSVSSDGGETITPPDGYQYTGGELVMVMSSSSGPPLFVDDGTHEVPQIRVDGAFFTPQAVNYTLDGVPQGDEVVVPSTLTEFIFQLPAGADGADFEYNNGTLEVLFVPNLVGTGPGDPQPVPVGVWRVSYVALRAEFESDEPLPYEPPPPPELLTLTYVRQFPTSHPGTWGSSPRIFPPPKVQRIIGGHQ